MVSAHVLPVAWGWLARARLTTLGTSPVSFLSTQAVFIRAELGFGELRFGAAVSTLFASAAAAALLCGDVFERIGARNSTFAAGSLTAAGGFGTAGLAHSWPDPLTLMIALGTANAACQVTSNLTLARVVSHRRHGIGVKQAAVPLGLCWPASPSLWSPLWGMALDLHHDGARGTTVGALSPEFRR